MGIENVLEFKSDPVATCYARVRDATVCNPDMSSGMCVAVLELVKAELLRAMLEDVSGR